MALFLAIAATVAVPPEEDAFIYYRYAWNWAHGHGLVFNLGDPVEGFSGPLWMAVLGLVARAGFDLPRAAPLLGVSCGAATIVATFALARHAGLGSWGRLGSAAAVALAEPHLVWSRSGLETPLYALLLTVACALHLGSESERERRAAHQRGAQWRVGIALSAVVLCRPESILLLLLVGVDRLHRSDRAGAIRYLAPAAVGYGALVAWRHATFGSLVPNTSVKLYTPLVARSTAQAASYVLSIGVWPAMLPLAALVGSRDRGSPDRHTIGFLFTASLLLSFFFDFVAGGDYRPGFRYFVPTLPILLVAGWVALESIERSRALRRRGTAALRTTPGAIPAGGTRSLASAAVARPGLRLPCLLLTLAAPLHARLANPPALSQWRERVLATWLDPYSDRSRTGVATARWMDANVRPGSVVAFGQMGMVPYYLAVRGHDVTFVDTLGLVDRAVARHYRMGAKLADLVRRVRSGASLARALDDGRRDRAQAVADEILGRSPDYVLLETELDANGMLQALASSPAFRSDYPEIAAIPSADEPRVRVHARSAPPSPPATPAALVPGRRLSRMIPLGHGRAPCISSAVHAQAAARSSAPSRSPSGADSR